MEGKIMVQNKPELVSPAGNWSSLYSAVEAGADSIYFGVKGMNMRQAADNFDIQEMKKIMRFLHKKGKRGYLALNIIIYNNELGKVKRILKAAANSKVDSVILWDMAVLSAAKENGLKVHLSTQASVSNFAALKFYHSLGVRRIVLARECTLLDIKDIMQKIKKEKINCEIEAFIHGAICVSVSGRCFLSQSSFAKSANRGECLQPCRRKFVITSAEDGSSYVLGKDYVLSTRDLCTMGFIDSLIESGIKAFKIEGRMRSPEYVSGVTACYRTAIDAFTQKRLTKKLKKDLIKKLTKNYNRGFSEGFYFGQPDDLGGHHKRTYEKIYLGDVRKFYRKLGVAEILIRNKDLRPNTKILITGKTTPASFAKVSEMEIDHKPVYFADKGKAVGVKLPFIVRPNDKVFIWRERC